MVTSSGVFCVCKQRVEGFSKTLVCVFVRWCWCVLGIYVCSLVLVFNLKETSFGSFVVWRRLGRVVKAEAC